MKLILSFALLLLSINTFAVETLNYTEVEMMFNNGGFPFLDAHIGISLPGRCVHKFEVKKIKPSVMLVSLGERFEIAPITVPNKTEDFFDDMTWEEIFSTYPEVNTQFMDVINLQNEIGLYKKELFGNGSALIRETNKFFILKTFRNDKFFRYCYYKKNY